MAVQTISELVDSRRDFLRFVRRRVADPGIAEDILQSAYLRAVERSSDLRQDESAAAWFYRILRNAIIDHYRRRATEASGLDRWLTELDASPAAMSTSQGKFTLVTRHPEAPSLLCRCIDAVISSLSPNYADVLREVDLEEVSLSDFASRHSITAANAAVRAHRARAALKRGLARNCGSCAKNACIDCTC